MVGDLVFIGSGAGKLPTASAVVSDVVDSVRHLNVSTTVMWDEEKLEIEDFAKSKKRFFVRANADKSEIEEVFGNVEYVDAGIKNEYGFITEKISEEEFAKKADKLGKVITRIRVEG
jgi:homoserine dehydrogenase